MIRSGCLTAALALSTVGASGQKCSTLTELKVEHIEITSARDVPPGTLQPQPQPGSHHAIPAAQVKAFCRVIGVARPAQGSEIGFEIWLPKPEAWNKRFEGVGNGAYAGRISYGALENAVNEGYATASTDTGHHGSELNFAVGHPEAIEDWGERSTHETAQVARKLIHAYYGIAPEHAYFNGCSTGGMQALSEAQRYPEDYDGILAGDAGNNRVHLNAGFLWAFEAAHPNGSLVLDNAALQLVHHAVLEACDAADGVKDGVLQDPLACQFDPHTVQCKAGEKAGCLTPIQADAVMKIYTGPRNPHTGEQIIGGYAPGSEIVTGGGDYQGWTNFITGPKEPARLDFWKLWVFHDPAWDWRHFDFDRDVTLADREMTMVNAVNPDLRRFAARGGKLLIYHGWVDPVGPPSDAINYFRNVEKASGEAERARSFLRLYMVPGMSHCTGGPGYELAGGARGVDNPDDMTKWPSPDAQHDMLWALDAWVSRGKAPDALIAAHYDNGKLVRTIKVCPFPQVARWTRKGSPDSSQNWVCRAQ
jgi:feruloyl esterase